MIVRMKPIFLGIDIAGKDNTWIAGISSGTNGIMVSVQPRKASLRHIVDFTEEKNVLSAAIDAQLTIALDDENGFRSSDMELRSYLPADCKTWVASINSLMAVPIRGQFIAGQIAMNVGTIIETHPRASLLFGLGLDALPLIRYYKKAANSEKTIANLWDLWSAQFGIQCDPVPLTDGALDALVCATVAYLYHTNPEKLYKLKHKSSSKKGAGPFYIVSPFVSGNFQSDMKGAS